MAHSFVQFIDERGGVSAVAKATGYGAGAVALWRHRNKIPRGAWPEIVEAFPDVSLKALKGIEAQSGSLAPRSQCVGATQKSGRPGAVIPNARGSS